MQGAVSQYLKGLTERQGERGQNWSDMNSRKIARNWRHSHKVQGRHDNSEPGQAGAGSSPAMLKAHEQTVLEKLDRIEAVWRGNNWLPNRY